ncbi:MAG: deaminase [Nitrospira sp.]|nr:deaminase [Nitrospira sp.]
MKPAIKPSKTSTSSGPELVIGLVGAVGTDLNRVYSQIEQELNNVGYESELIHLIELLPDFNGSHVGTLTEENRVDFLMTQGNKFRKKNGRGDALARLALGAIRETRENNAAGDPNIPLNRHAYVLRSLKNPQEEETLRNIYGNAFILLAAYSPRHLRLETLTRKIAQSYNSSDYDLHRAKAEHLIQRDASEDKDAYGQNLRATFPRADIFLNTSEPKAFEASLKRFIEMLFRYPFHTPTPEEYCMFIAQAASLRSADLGRQVGAAIANDEGAIIAVGTNEVPKAGGGLYWTNDTPDHRDFRWPYASSETLRAILLSDILNRLQGKGWFNKAKSKLKLKSLAEEAMASMKDAHFMNLIEFQRAVHAEMAALLDAARRGVSVKNCTLYTTTFPCHDCAKHIVAAGIKKVVYIYPYPKSRAGELYPDSISLDGLIEKRQSTDLGGPVLFEPFVGVAPRRYLELFTMNTRKKDGKAVKWKGNRQNPKGVDDIPFSYLAKENKYLQETRNA